MAKKVTTSDKPKSIGPFDIIGYMFSNQDEFNKLSDKVLEKNYFIINDRFSINFPMQAAVFNHYKINGAMVVKCWNTFIRRFNYTRTPSWMFVKGKAKTAETNKNLNLVSKESIKKFAEYMNVSTKEIDFALSIYPTQVKQEIDEYEKHLAEIEKLKKMSLSSLKEKNEEQEPEMELDMENTVAIF